MREEIEIEFKQLLNEAEYKQLEDFFKEKNAKVINQENLYFETPDKTLKKQKKAMRIRVIDNNYELCLKTQRENDMSENNIDLSSTEYKKIMNDNSEITKYLDDIPKDVRLLGSLHTKRMEYKVPQGLFCLDLSNYFDIIDYEIEFEAINYEYSDFLKNFLNEFGIEYKENKRNKIQRFSEKLDEISQDNKNML